MLEIAKSMLRRPYFIGPFLLFVLIPLHCIPSGLAQAEYEHAFKLFQHGHLARSQEEAQQDSKRFLVSDPELAARFRCLEADAMVWRGMNEDAQRLLSSQPSSIRDPETRIRELTEEAIALTRLQQFPMASQRLIEADMICSVADHTTCGDVLRARGILAVDEEKFNDGRQLFLKSRAFAVAHHDRWLETVALLNLSWTSLQSERFDEAVDWSQSTYRAAIERGEEDLAQRASGDLGWAYFNLGDYERALDLFVEAEKRATELGDVSAQLNWLKTAAYVYREYGKPMEAEATLRQALNISARLNSRTDTVDILEDLSHVAVETGDLAAASAYIDRVAPMARASGSNLDISYVSLAQGKLAAARRQDAQAEALFRAVEHDQASQVSMRFGAEHELARLFEVEGRANAARDTYKTALLTFERARDQLKGDDSKLPFLANATRIYDDYIHFLVSQGKAEEALVTADQSRARTLAQGLGQAPNQTSSEGVFKPASFSPRAVAAKSGATLLFYWLGEKQSYLWVIAPENISLFTLPAQSEIIQLIERYRRTLLGVEDPLESGNMAGRDLYAMLVAPAAKLISPSRPVMVLADGALSQLNFETLIVPGQQPGLEPHYWIDDVTLMAAPSLAMLSAAKPDQTTTVQRKGKINGKLLILGDAVSPSEEFPGLPFAAQEMKEITTHFAAEDEVVFSREQATPSAYVKSDPRQFSYIHFVSHGVASRTDPLDSAIILSRTGSTSNASTGDEKFKLYARDIMQHAIDARVVTISACNGSGARTFSGEGLVGLSWAFLRAGAHSAIGGLWEVSDESTPQLMDALYQGIEEGKSPATALRKAKLNLLHSRSSFRKPFYWAPFQIYTRS